MGAGRRQQHAREQAKRDAAAEADRIRRQQEESQKAYQAMIDALKPKAVVDTTPKPVQSTIADTRTGVRTARSGRQTTTGLAKGLASLRIPLNVGATSGNLNIG